ncbi:MAG: hypothetical protein ACOYBH_05260 [Candidatus Alectryocaccobium sp.]|jgi:hypothetical protein|nr:hypothetical protein [Lachnospiraceae bacterium]MDY6222217.1 hypothetical protein [Candidatus Alectryocaccobium sp.]
MSECTHDCNTCGGGCHGETPDGQKPRDVLKELKNFAYECESDEMVDMFSNIAKDFEDAVK